MRRLAPLLAAFLFAVLIAGCGAAAPKATGKSPTPKPTAKPSPMASPCPVSAQAYVRVRGCVTLNAGDNLDLDSGEVNVTTFDIAFTSGAVTLGQGTTAAYLGVRDFDSLGTGDIATANLGTSSYNVGELQPTGVLAVKTGDGRLAKVRFDTVSNQRLTVSFFTWLLVAPLTAPQATPTPSSTCTSHCSSSTPTPTPTPTSHTTPSASASPHT